MTEEKRKSIQKKSYKQNTLKIFVTQIASEKVVATVTTFLSEGLYGLKMIQRNDHSNGTGKVAFVVGAFLKVVCAREIIFGKFYGIISLTASNRKKQRL
ncbi:hypothetical protein [Emticicia fontis]